MIFDLIIYKLNLIPLKAKYKIIWNHLSCLVGAATHLHIQTHTHTHTLFLFNFDGEKSDNKWEKGKIKREVR